MGKKRFLSDKEASLLKREILDRLDEKPIPKIALGGSRARIGIISDTHIGSIYDQHRVLAPAYQAFKAAGCELVLHAGDMLDGEGVYLGQEYDLYAHGVQQQVEQARSIYPSDVPTLFITGNHDLSFWKRAGVDPGVLIAEDKEYLTYLGKESAEIEINGARIHVIHPSKGTAYALSYHPQKYVESITPKDKPELVVIGHFHKAEFLPAYQDVFVLQAGAIESQTPFMRRKNLAAHNGFWVVDFATNHGKITSMSAEFIRLIEAEGDTMEKKNCYTSPQLEGHNGR